MARKRRSSPARRAGRAQRGSITKSRELKPHEERHAWVVIMFILASLVALLSILGYIGYQ